MTISIRRTAKNVIVTIDGTGTHFETPEAAIEFLRGRVRETQSAVNSAIEMWHIAECDRAERSTSNTGSTGSEARQCVR